MPRTWVPYSRAALICGLLAGFSAPAAAEFFGCNDQHPVRQISYTQASPYARVYAQARPRVTIYPRYHAKRYCQSWLAKEYRVSGPVIVPRMRCWWR